MAFARSRGARMRSDAFGYVNLVPYVFFVLFPFYFMAVTSFKSNAELYNLKSIPFWIHSGMITDHYTFLFAKTEFLTWMTNSLLVAVVELTTSTSRDLVNDVGTDPLRTHYERGRHHHA